MRTATQYKVWFYCKNPVQSADVRKDYSTSSKDHIHPKMKVRYAHIDLTSKTSCVMPLPSGQYVAATRLHIRQ